MQHCKFLFFLHFIQFAICFKSPPCCAYLSISSVVMSPSTLTTPRSAITSDAVEAFPDIPTNDNQNTSLWPPLTGSNNIEIGQIMELHRVSFLAQYGDYAGCLFNRLRAIALEKGVQLPRTINACTRRQRVGGGTQRCWIAVCDCCERMDTMSTQACARCDRALHSSQQILPCGGRTQGSKNRIQAMARPSRRGYGQPGGSSPRPLPPL